MATTTNRTIARQLLLIIALEILAVQSSRITCITVSSDTKNCTAEIDENVPSGTHVFTPANYISGFLIKSFISGSNILNGHFNELSNKSLYTQGTLDREGIVDRDTAPYPVKIELNYYSLDNGKTLNLLILVVDINDNVPRFKKGTQPLSSTYNHSFIETLGPAILTLEVEDLDEGLNGTSSVELVQPNPPAFNMTIELIGSRPWQIRIKPLVPLDREERDSYNFQLVASEGIANPAVTTMNVTITVIDYNDNPPMFQYPEYYMNVTELSPVNTSIVTVHADDADIGSNAIVEYSIREICAKATESASCLDIAPLQPFALDTESGLLTIKETLNYEDVVEYRVTVDASNPQGGSSTALVRVEILDVNDNAPEVTASLSGSFVEGRPIDSLYKTFTVQDADSQKFSSFHVFLLDSATQANSTAFGISEGSQLFRIVTLAEIDRETQDRYDLTLKVVDALNPLLYNAYNFTISIADDNDHAPVFDPINNPITVAENSGYPTLVTQISATDQDIGSNAAIRYFYVSPQSNQFPYEDLFTVKPVTGNILVGTLTFSPTLDRETTPNLTIIVQARDIYGQGKATNLTLTIILTDVNDNSPQLTAPFPTQVPLTENVPLSWKVIDVNATDSDEGSNAHLTYSVVSTSSNVQSFPFVIDPSNGMITTNGTIDHESISEYPVRVTVTDGSTQPLQVDFTIVIEDVNDNDPMFDELQYYSTLKENVTLGTYVTTIVATDSDSIAHTNISYYFVVGDLAFHLDSATGVVTTSQHLNWETKSVYNLVVRATDGFGRYTPSDATLNVTVVDINDEIPQFVGAPYVFTISEGNQANALVGNVTVKSIEQGPNGMALFNIDTVGVPFQINENTGMITATSTLNREETDKYKITVRVTDQAPPPHYNTTVVTIHVSDINDNPPEFNEDLVPISLSENHAVNSPFYTAHANDRDIYPNNVTNYYITEGSSHFQINSETGELSIATSLNYEMEQSILVEVTAKDEGNPDIFFDTLRINVTVLDDNNTNITFPQSFPLQVSISEDTPINFLIVNFTGEDSKGNPKLHLNYYLTNQSGVVPEEFGIEVEPSTGYALITVTDELNREAKSTYLLNITITDQGTPPSKVTQFLTINLLDVNDNAPTFISSQYAFPMKENLPGKRLIGAVMAVDPDEGLNGTVTYALGNTFSGLFSVQSGSIYQESSLDHELTDVYNLVVIASDLGTPPKTSQVDVVVNVIDVNDNYPTFTPWLVQVEENVKVGTIVVNLVGYDADTGSNSQITYSVADGSNATSHFQLLSNGTIRVINVPDYEMETEFIFYVSAQDGGTPPLVTTGNVTLKIVDQNDNCPQFVGPPSIYNLALPENLTLWSTILNITAVDPDQGLAGTVEYAFEDEVYRLQFQLDKVTGNLQLFSNFDYEKAKSIDVSILAYDLGKPRNKICSQNVHIDLINVNEFPPSFDQAFYVLRVDEGTSFTTFATLRAYDEDSDSVLTYSLSHVTPPTDAFVVATMNGAALFSTSKGLDYNAQSVYSAVITATDEGGRQASSGVYIVINNINDHSPVFGVNVYNSSVSESATIDTAVITVKATDSDNNTNTAVTYSIIGGNVGDVFSVSLTEGTIYVSGSLDYETTPGFVLSVQATDTGAPPRSAVVSVIVNVLNENEYAPAFTSSLYSFNLVEESPVGAVVGAVNATDQDKGNYGSVAYTFQSPSSQFAIGPTTGIITTLVRIDREATPTIAPLVVVANDSTKTSTTTVSISISDINDNPPLFSDSLYSLSVDLSSPADTIVGTVTANDADLSSNTQYSITSTVSLPFIINSTSGTISVTQSLSAVNEPYQFTLTATDAGNSSLTSQTTVQIFIVSPNDHYPVFTQRVYTASIVENIVPSNHLLTVQADDPDTGSNGLIRYSFIGNSLTYNQFTIGELSGHISLSQPLDYENETVHNIVVYARDDTPSHPRTATALVTITVINANDNRPQLVDFPSSLTISYVPRLNLNLFQLSAEDLDGSPYTFQLWSQTDKFSINPNTGIVSNIIVLDTTVSYTLVFRVTDGNYTAKTMTLNIVSPPNDAPLLQGDDPLYETVSEAAPVGKLITTFFSLNSPTSYRLVCCGDSLDMFTVDSQNGAFRLASQLDYESVQAYHVVVEARKTSGPNSWSSDYMEVLISVSNVNEFTPQFSSVTPVKINENLGAGFPVTQVIATDDDFGAYGNVTYQIISGNTGNAFSIDPDNGAVSVFSSIIDREMVSHYDLLIRAEDGGGKQSTITLPIAIQDQNDSPPSFPSNYTIGVYEPGATGDVVLQIRAIDPDSDSVLTYSMGTINAYKGSTSKGIVQKFTMNSTTGIIRLSSPLDYSSVDSYVFQVSASDSLFTATTDVTVGVLDINNISPQFNQGTYYVSFMELSPPGTLLQRVRATDGDSHAHSMIRYSLGNDWPTSKFVIDEEGGSIRVKEPIGYLELKTSCYDKNTSNVFTSTVLATDGVHNVSALVTVTVTDINNLVPQFNVTSLDIVTSETSTVGTVLRGIHVDDYDCFVNGYYNTFLPDYYHLPHSSFNFNYIAADEYQLTVKNPLSQGVYHFRLIAFNPGPTSVTVQYFTSSYVPVTVTVLPFNAHGPVFSPISALNVSENVELSLEIGTITATDMDLGVSGHVNYFITSSSVPFAIDNTTGVITVSGPIDYETKETYLLEILAVDNGYPVKTNTATLRVNVLDEDDNPPLFTRDVFSGEVVENSPTSTPILSVKVTDADTVTRVSYSIVQQDLPFTIDPSTGTIVTSGSIDYEYRTSYEFTIRSSDNEKMFDTASIKINVTGVNEFAPVISPPNDPIVLSETLREGDFIVTVTARDDDKGDDGVVRFSLETDNSYLEILPNGTIISRVSFADIPPITTTGSRKRQTNSMIITSTIIASDSGNPPMRDSVNITFVLPQSGQTPTLIASPMPSPFLTTEVIAIMTSVIGALIIFIIIVIILITVVISRSRRLNKSKFDLRQPANNVQLTEIPREEESSENVELRYVVPPVDPLATPVKKTSSNSQLQKNVVEERDYNSEQYRPQYNRSTSDLASSVATDTLNLTQETSFPYPKAQIEAIYAANADLLDDGSQASVHTFGSEGGGESVGDEFDTLYYTKYEEMDGEGSMMGGDDISCCSKDRNSMISVTSEGREDEYHFSQSTNPWSSRRSINDLMGEGSRLMYQFEHSQGASGYGISTQGSSVSLMHSHHPHNRSKYPPTGSNRDVQSHSQSHSHHHHHKPSHPPAPRHTYDYFTERSTPPAPISLRSQPTTHHQYGSPIFDYRSQMSVAPPPYLSQDPAPHHSFTQGSRGIYYGRSPDPVQFDQRMLSNSSTSLSTSASHPYSKRRGYH